MMPATSRMWRASACPSEWASSIATPTTGRSGRHSITELQYQKGNANSYSKNVEEGSEVNGTASASI